MARLVMMLCPPRSFSSLVSTMIGQHPQIYGFPELHLVVRERLSEVMEWEVNRAKFLGPPGMLRAMAELMFGGQTPENVLTAANWLEDRKDWKSVDVMNMIMDKAEEKTGAIYCLEKTPNVSFVPPALERVRRNWPDALYIHVTRHPVGLKKSIEEYVSSLPRFSEEEKQARLDNAMSFWPITQRNILDFCGSLNPGQYIRIRGEDVLSDSHNVMSQVAEFLGLRTDDEAITAMLHPENSPYAYLGPPLAAYGNDMKFVSNPVFRPGKIKMPSLANFFETEEGAVFDDDRKAYLTQLANCLGYS